MEIIGNYYGKPKRQSAVKFKLPEAMQKRNRPLLNQQEILLKKIRSYNHALVSTFTIQSQQKNAQFNKSHLIKPSNFNNNQKEWNRFRLLYDNGHLPVRLEQRGSGKLSRNIRWLEDPKFITVERFPYSLIAERGVADLLKNYVNSESGHTIFTSTCLFFRDVIRNEVHDIEYKYGKSISECFEETLNTLEKVGYPKAFPAIKRLFRLTRVV
ncbi:hypothetical protein DINM_003007 [Dirofilaria immitis]|nr:hypothetical protein [Dirofilaria immitis]